MMDAQKPFYADLDSSDDDALYFFDSAAPLQDLRDINDEESANGLSGHRLRGYSPEHGYDINEMTVDEVVDFLSLFEDDCPARTPYLFPPPLLREPLYLHPRKRPRTAMPITIPAIPDDQEQSRHVKLPKTHIKCQSLQARKRFKKIEQPSRSSPQTSTCVDDSFYEAGKSAKKMADIATVSNPLIGADHIIQHVWLQYRDIRRKGLGSLRHDCDKIANPVLFDHPSPALAPYYVEAQHVQCPNGSRHVQIVLKLVPKTVARAGKDRVTYWGTKKCCCGIAFKLCFCYGLFKSANPLHKCPHKGVCRPAVEERLATFAQYTPRVIQRAVL